MVRQGPRPRPRPHPGRGGASGLRLATLRVNRFPLQGEREGAEGILYKRTELLILFIQIKKKSTPPAVTRLWPLPELSCEAFPTSVSSAGRAGRGASAFELALLIPIGHQRERGGAEALGGRGREKVGEHRGPGTPGCLWGVSALSWDCPPTILPLCLALSPDTPAHGEQAHSSGP